MSNKPGGRKPLAAMAPPAMFDDGGGALPADVRESRFAHLLQPIRDLAANWDVDIAAELEDYLGELEGMTFAVAADAAAAASRGSHP